ncbi:PAS domain S-box protein [Azospirillum cavernae]|uniref:histidine kinase n=2 Tax=Azospirillum cavernae TaxID=2320860 RepID=A0A418VZ77_9PROT|nr:PAS domain S-box protein [Azospirillum cavernae]
MRALMRNARDVAAVVAPDGSLSYVGEAAARVLGYSSDRLIGTQLIDHAHPDERDEVRRRIAARLIAPASVSSPAVFRFRHADGRWRWVEAVSNNQSDDPDIGGVVLNVRDVTEQLDTAERLRVSEARYQTLAETAPVGIFQTDSAGEVIFANARFASIAGLTLEQLLGSGWLDAVHPQDRAQVEADWRGGLDRGAAAAPLLLDFRFHDAAASVDMRVLCQRVPLEGDGGFIGTITDVSEYVRTANALLLSEARNKATVDTAADAILTMDDDDCVVSFNRAAEEMFGVAAPDILWNRLDSLFPAAQLRETDGQRFEFPPGQTTAVIARSRSIEARRVDGTVFPIELSVSASEVEGRRFYTGILRDVTERRRAEQEMIAAREAAEAADKAKSVFVATVSHELRTPLNAVIGFAQLLEMKQGEPTTELYPDYVRSIRQSGEQLLSIIDDILDITRIQTGRLELMETPLDLDALVTQAVSDMSFVANHSAVRLDVQVDETLPPIRGDERRLRQALCNLISNGVKFSHPNDVVTVSAGRDADGWVTLVVRDTGIGLDPANIPRVTVPFVQLDQSMARRFDGLGLGLPLAHRLVEAHGGSLTIESQLEQGCAVTIRLPPERVLSLDDLLR